MPRGGCRATRRSRAATAPGTDLNGLLALGTKYWTALRAQLSELLRDGSSAARTPGLADRILARASDVSMRLPAAIGDYTDFYASMYHATNVGAMFRPDNPLLPNYKWVPIGYHGRASSIVPSGTPRAATGRADQTGGRDACRVFGPTQALDYEAEIGFFVGPGIHTWRPDSDRRGGVTPVRRVPRQRLVRA